MKPFLIANALLVTLALPQLASAQNQAPDSIMQDAKANQERRDDGRLSFQTLQPWMPRTNVNGDVAMVYGIDDAMPARIKTWRDRGYRIHVMTGVAWGEYQDYLFGRFDGKNHEDESQTTKNGDIIGHGVNVPYMSPGEDYGNFLSLGVKKALDAGAEAVHLEEPEFWVRAGYSPSFKREWKKYYNEDWQDPTSSVDASYRSAKLKYFLYRRALSQVFTFVKAYGVEHGREIPCYVPTHSLINYAQWGIVSPQSSLLDVGADGYIAQVWTGTSREPNTYNNVTRERTFETAFLEYGQMQNMVRASGRRMYFLNDPIEDNANHSWDDYRTNWESTLVASLLQGDIWHYEIMPWPERIWNDKYPVKEASQRPPGPVEKTGIPASYETELQSVINSLGQMKQPSVKWEASGTNGVGVLVSDSLMFERGDPTPSDGRLGSFYGLAMPLIKHGIPVVPVQLESSIVRDDFLSPYKVLVLTYEGQKPPSPAIHAALAKWVRAGGALVFIDRDGDPYNKVREWWNQGGSNYATPRQHLMEQLGLDKDFVGGQKVGKGYVLRAELSPAALTFQTDGGETIRNLTKQAAQQIGLPWRESNALVLSRGPFVIASGLDESVEGAPAQTVNGHFIDLFDADLPMVTRVELQPRRRAYLFNLDATSQTPQVVAAACRVQNEKAMANSLSFQASGVAATNAVVRALVPQMPKSVTVGGKALAASQMDADALGKNQVLRLRFPNAVDAQMVEIKW